MPPFFEQGNAERIPESAIDAMGHVIRTAGILPGESGYNPKIEVFREGMELGSEQPNRGQIYQLWAVTCFAENIPAFAAAQESGLIGNHPEQENWTQLLEHISGVLAIAIHINRLLGTYGGEMASTEILRTATLFDNLDKAEAIAAGIRMAEEAAKLDTAVLVHDLEKPAEIEAARRMAEENVADTTAGGTSAGGLENSRDNPVLREGRLWRFLEHMGVNDSTLQAAQNTGRSDRFYGPLEDYSDNAVKKAMQDRTALAVLLGARESVVDAMSPDERRTASIGAKGTAAAIVGISDAVAAQFKFQGVTDPQIDAMSARYLTYKKDPESAAFFSQDWPAYYKLVRHYLIRQVPEANRGAFVGELESLTHEKIYNETVLPEVLGETALRAAGALREAGLPNSYDNLRYTEEA